VGTSALGASAHRAIAGDQTQGEEGEFLKERTSAESTLTDGAGGMGYAERIQDAALASIRTLSEAGWQEVLPEILRALGEAAHVSRAYLYRNVTLPDGRLAMDMFSEWVAPGITTAIDRPDFHDWPYDEGYERYVEVLSSGGEVCGPTSEFPAGEIEELQGENIRSTAFVSVHAGEEWWGFLGCDDCVEPRRWFPADIRALKAVAAILGGAIHRNRLDQEARAKDLMMSSHLESLPLMTYIEYEDEDEEAGYSEAYVSPQVEQILGYTPDEYLNELSDEEWRGSIHLDDRALVDDAMEKALRADELSEIEFRFRRKDGKWIWVRDEWSRGETTEGMRPYVHGVMMDITARKEAEVQREFQAKLLESISDAIVAYDQEMIVTSWNRAAEVLYGWTAEEVVGQPLPEALRYHQDDPGVTTIWDPFVEKMHGRRSTVTQRDRDGYQIPVETLEIPLFDAAGRSAGHVMVNREVADS